MKNSFWDYCLNIKGLTEFGLFCSYFSLTFLFYYGSLGNFLVHDDFVFLKAASGWSLSANFHFFPLPMLIYDLSYAAFGTNPVPVRVLLFIFNAVVCLVLFKTVIRFYSIYTDQRSERNSFYIASSVSLLFCLHFVHVENLVYFSELPEMLYSLFYLLGIYFYFCFRSGSNVRNYWIMVLCFVLSLLSKEVAVSFIICIFISELFFFKNTFIGFIKRYHYLITVTVLVILLRLTAGTGFEKLEYPENMIVVLKEIIKNIMFVFTAFVVSLDFTLIRDIYKSGGTDLMLSLTGIAEAYPFFYAYIAGVILLYLLILFKKGKTKIITLSFIFITISAFFWIAGFERYLYLPSAAFWILLADFFLNRKLNDFRTKIISFAFLALFLIYNIISLTKKQSNWEIASEISRKTVNDIKTVTGTLPPGTKVYFKDLPGDYKGAWILRDGIHEIPELMLKRNDISFYYEYELLPEKKKDVGVYLYDFKTNKLIKPD